MKASELRDRITQLIEKHGDLEVVSDDHGSPYASLVDRVSLEEWPCRWDGKGYAKIPTKVMKICAADSTEFSVGY